MERGGQGKMSARNIGVTGMLVTLLLLMGIFFPLLLYILPLLFCFAISCLYTKPQADVPVPNRNIRDVSIPRGPPRMLPLFNSQ
jgi:uncharacterized membrane protein YkgB